MLGGEARRAQAGGRQSAYAWGNGSGLPVMLSLLSTFSWPEWRHHPWRALTAVVAVMLGVALAFSVQLINASALAEFSSAVQAVNGQPDLALRARAGDADDRLLERALARADVQAASPVLERQTLVLRADGQALPVRLPLRVLGVDALSVAAVAPTLMPVLGDGRDDGGNARRLDLFAADALFLNPAARLALGNAQTLTLQHGPHTLTWREAGTVQAPGEPLVVMDIAAAQDAFGALGRISRLDLRLRPGTDTQALWRALDTDGHWQPLAPEAGAQRVSNLSRAYRVNLTVLALVALFTGAFLVYSVVSLGVAKRLPQFALLGVLGLDARARQRLVLAESALLGLAGSAAGLALGAALAALALRWLGGDLGGGYFASTAPPLRLDGWTAAGYGALGLLAALAGGWWPARAAARLAPAQALKGLGSTATSAVAGGRQVLPGLGLMALAGALAFAPPVGGVPLAAYGAVGLLLLGGLVVLPPLVQLGLRRVAPAAAHHALALLALERARRVPAVVAVATSGVVAALALSVALTVMVASFRDSVTRWLDVVLPAPLYLRAANTSAAADSAWLAPGLLQALEELPAVSAVQRARVRALPLAPDRAPVVLLARDWGPRPQPEQWLPLVGAARAAPTGHVPVYVSEAMVDLYGARVGQVLPALASALGLPADTPFFVAGVWRDYARQHGSIAMALDDLQALLGEQRANEAAIHLVPGADATEAQRAVRERLAQHGAQELVELATADAIRAVSLRIFDRSFAVTYWLQAVAIAIGLFGVAASFSAQALARRREFGLLAHLGLTRAQVLRLVAAEGLVWTTLGALAGLLLGLGVSLVLVHVVNPQSFHWTMDLVLPWPRLLALCVAVVAAGTATAWLSGRAAAGRDAVRSVKDDW